MTINNLNKLVKLMEKVEQVASEVRESVDEKREWWLEKSEKWQEGEVGQKWDDFILDVESFLDDVENISIPSFED